VNILTFFPKFSATGHMCGGPFREGFSANRSRGGAQFVVQCGQWQHSALREF
jgi:hypothetical protein